MIVALTDYATGFVNGQIGQIWMRIALAGVPVGAASLAVLVVGILRWPVAEPGGGCRDGDTPLNGEPETE
jgi:hypothetical protein